MPDDTIVANQQRLHERLRQIVDAVPQFVAIVVIDRQGKPLASSALRTIAREVNAVDRAYFELMRPAPRAPWSARYWRRVRERSNDHFFNLSRRRLSPDGAFNGVVSVAVLPRYFEEFYARIGRGPGSLYSLVRADGTFSRVIPCKATVRARSIHRARCASRSPRVWTGRSIPYRNPRSTRSTGGSVIASSRIPGLCRGRRSTARRSGPSGSQPCRPHLVYGLPATFFLFLIIGVALQRTRRLHDEAERREAAEAALRQAQRLEAIGQLTGGVATTSTIF